MIKGLKCLQSHLRCTFPVVGTWPWEHYVVLVFSESCRDALLTVTKQVLRNWPITAERPGVFNNQVLVQDEASSQYQPIVMYPLLVSVSTNLGGWISANSTVNHYQVHAYCLLISTGCVVHWDQGFFLWLENNKVVVVFYRPKTVYFIFIYSVHIVSGTG